MSRCGADRTSRETCGKYGVVADLTPFDAEYHLDVDRKIAAALERVAQALKVMLWDEAKTHRLSPLQAGVLIHLLSVPEPAARVGSLARDFDVSQPTMSDAVAALHRKGLITKRSTASDARAATLSLTADGKALAVRMGGWNETLRTRLKQLPDDDKSVVLRFLFDLIRSLQEAGVITVARMCITCRFFRPHGDPTQPGRHFCALLKVPLEESALRIDCPEHVLAPGS
jgi:DNA-binding MarR family transcriptional regulator